MTTVSSKIPASDTFCEENKTCGKGWGGHMRLGGEGRPLWGGSSWAEKLEKNQPCKNWEEKILDREKSSYKGPEATGMSFTGA